jgi:hypothetical protein
MAYDDEGESPLARRLRRRRIVFGWIVLAGLFATVAGTAISQIFG